MLCASVFVVLILCACGVHVIFEVCAVCDVVLLYSVVNIGYGDENVSRRNTLPEKEKKIQLKELNSKNINRNYKTVR